MDLSRQSFNCLIVTLFKPHSTSCFDSPDLVDVESSTDSSKDVSGTSERCFDSPDVVGVEIIGKVERSRGLKTH